MICSNFLDIACSLLCKIKVIPIYMNYFFSFFQRKRLQNCHKNTSTVLRYEKSFFLKRLR